MNGIYIPTTNHISSEAHTRVLIGQEGSKETYLEPRAYTYLKNCWAVHELDLNATGRKLSGHSSFVGYDYYDKDVEEMVKMGELQRKDARLHPEKNIITRAVGVMDSVDADFFEVDDLHDGDVVLMCSDGLSNMLEDNEMAGIISGVGTLEDNIAVVLIRVNVERKS